VNPYLLDFFSLARGYAMAISFMLMSIYYFREFIDEPKRKKLIISFMAACLAVMVNFALLNYLAALMIMYECYLANRYLPFKNNYKTVLSKNKIVLLVSAIMLGICYQPINALKKTNQFYAGGTTGFWKIPQVL